MPYKTMSIRIDKEDYNFVKSLQQRRAAISLKQLES